MVSVCMLVDRSGQKLIQDLGIGPSMLELTSCHSQQWCKPGQSLYRSISLLEDFPFRRCFGSRNGMNSSGTHVISSHTIASSLASSVRSVCLLLR